MVGSYLPTTDTIVVALNCFAEKPILRYDYSGSIANVQRISKVLDITKIYHSIKYKDFN